MGFTASGISATTVTTDQQAPLGFVLTVPDGDQGNQSWVYVKAGEALSEGRICMFKDATSNYEVMLTTESGVSIKETRARCVGVAQHAIASGSYGFVLARGFGTILAGTGAALTTNVGITPGGADVSSIAGCALPFASSGIGAACVIGHNTGTTIATSGTGEVYIDCGL
tara:strand:- start:14662 stop:15168 length:507 start_codon:yes stop_codon:yes gene_type:complete